MRIVLFMIALCFSNIIFPMNVKDESLKKIIGSNEVKTRILNLGCRNLTIMLEDFFNQNRNVLDIAATLNQPIHSIPILHNLVGRVRVNKEIIEILLREGANPNFCLERDEKLSRDPGYTIYYKGYTAAHIAIKKRRSDLILDVLKKFGANFDQPDFFGFTPIDVAICDHNCHGYQYLKKLGFKAQKSTIKELKMNELIEQRDEKNKEENLEALERLLEAYSQKNEQMLEVYLQKTRETQENFEWRIYYYLIVGGFCFICGFLGGL